MPDVDKHPPGAFCWIELGTTDPVAAKQFYASLFGWTINDMPMGPGEIYTIYTLAGRQAAASYGLNAEMRSHGVPPHWMIYIAVDSADGIAAKAAAAGGKIIAPAFDVMDFGRMAVLRDPAGAGFSVWQAKSHTGIGIAGVPGSLCWADLMTPVPSDAAKFYGELFGWKIEPGKDASGYLHIKNGETFIGGMPPAEHRNPNAPPHWLLYFLVDNCDASAAAAKAAGARFYVEPMTLEGVGRMAVVADPQGAVFALFQPAPREG